MPGHSSGSRCFLDTNLIVYSYDARDDHKRARSLEVLRELRRARAGVISAQVLGELYVTLVRKVAPALSAEEAEHAVHTHAVVWPVLPVTAACVEAAMAGARQHAMSFWDALIWATAVEANASCVLTEDCQHGRRIEGVLYLNPFDDSFDLVELSL